jgi:peroxiredoxin
MEDLTDAKLAAEEIRKKCCGDIQVIFRDADGNVENHWRRKIGRMETVDFVGIIDALFLKDMGSPKDAEITALFLKDTSVDINAK